MDEEKDKGELANSVPVEEHVHRSTSQHSKSYTRPMSLMTRSQDKIFRKLDEWDPHPWTPVAHVVHSRILQPFDGPVETYVRHIHTKIGSLFYKLALQPLFGAESSANPEYEGFEGSESSANRQGRQEFKVEEWFLLSEFQGRHAARPLRYDDIQYIYHSFHLVPPSQIDYEQFGDIDRLWNHTVPSTKEQNKVRVEKRIGYTAIYPVDVVYGHDVWSDFLATIDKLNGSSLLKHWVHYRLVLWTARLTDAPSPNPMYAQPLPLYALFKPDMIVLNSTHKSILCSSALLEERSNVFLENTDWMERKYDIQLLQQMFESIVRVLLQLFPTQTDTLTSMKLLVGGVHRWPWHVKTTGLPVLAAMMLSHQERLRRWMGQVGQVYNRTEWRHVGYYEVNAYYIRELNSIYIPMSWFTIEGFWPRMSKSMTRRWAGLGMVLAHECAHAIDNEGVRVKHPLHVRSGAPDRAWALRWNEYMTGRLPEKGKEKETETEDGCDLVAMDVVSTVIGTALPQELEDEFQTHFSTIRQPLTYDDPEIRQTFRAFLPQHPTVHRTIIHAGSPLPFTDSKRTGTMSGPNTHKTPKMQSVHSDEQLRVLQSLKWRSRRLASSFSRSGSTSTRMSNDMTAE